MRTSKRFLQCQRPRMILSVAAVASILSTTDAAATSSEIDSFEFAVSSQNKQAALAFINEFSSSHLAGDLIELLRPEVAHEVCAALPSGAESAQDACRKLNVRIAVPQTASEKPQPIPSRDSAVEPEPPQSAAEDAAAQSGISDTAVSPGAGPAAPTQELASTTSRGAGTTGERSYRQTTIPLLPTLADNSAAPADDEHAKKPASTEEPDNAPKPPHDPAPPAPSFGSDPGSDPGSAPSPSSHGKDPGSDGGSASGGGSGHDSHN